MTARATFGWVVFCALVALLCCAGRAVGVASHAGDLYGEAWLPPGWLPATDERGDRVRTYFWDTATNRTTWSRPSWEHQRYREHLAQHPECSGLRLLHAIAERGFAAVQPCFVNGARASFPGRAAGTSPRSAPDPAGAPGPESGQGSIRSSGCPDHAMFDRVTHADDVVCRDHRGTLCGTLCGPWIPSPAAAAAECAHKDGAEVCRSREDAPPRGAFEPVQDAIKCGRVTSACELERRNREWEQPFDAGQEEGVDVEAAPRADPDGQTQTTRCRGGNECVAARDAGSSGDRFADEMASRRVSCLFFGGEGVSGGG